MSGKAIAAPEQGPHAATLRSVLAHSLGVGREHLLRAGRIIASSSRVVFTGMGEDYWAGAASAWALDADHPGVTERESSELVRRPPPHPGVAYVVFSASGEGAESAAIAQHARAMEARVIAVTASRSSTVGRNAEVVVGTRIDVPRASPCVTTSGLMLAGLLLCEAACGREPGDMAKAILSLAAELDRGLPAFSEGVEPLAAGLVGSSCLHVLSHGAGLSVAGLAALMISGRARVPCASLSIDAFHHGPHALCASSADVLAIDLAPDPCSLARVEGLRRRGANVSVLGARVPPSARSVCLPGGSLPEAYRPLAALPYLEVLTTALSHGRNVLAEAPSPARAAFAPEVVLPELTPDSARSSAGR